MEKIKYLIYEGGGTKAVVTTGMSLALEREVPNFSLEDAEFVLATSGATATLFYSLSHASHGDEQDKYEHITQKVCLELLADKQFVDISLNRIFGKEPIMNIEYLTSTLFRREAPFNESMIRDVKQGWAFPTYCMIEQSTVFVCNERGAEGIPLGCKRYVISEKDDLYNLLAAAKSAPVLSNRSFIVGAHMLLDGAIEFPLPIVSYESKSLILLSSRRTGLWTGIKCVLLTGVLGNILQLWKKDRLPAKLIWKAGMRKIIHWRQLRKLKPLEKSGLVLVIEPLKNLGSNRSNGDDVLKSNFDMGYETVRRMKNVIADFVG